MTQTDGFFFVFSNALEGQEDEFNTWYDETHLAEVCAVPGISEAQRYTAATMPLEGADPDEVDKPEHKYLAVYNVTGDPADVLHTFLDRMNSGDLTISPAFDFSTLSMGFWDPIGERVYSQD
ncbi:MAG: hypothetical protein JWP31_687 [Aeromicrobium sp.]|nr:hypothetical protein [Aeromicrobium sp.]